MGDPLSGVNSSEWKSGRFLARIRQLTSQAECKNRRSVAAEEVT